MSSTFGPSGGVGGSPFSAPAPTANGPWRINAVEGRSGSRIDQIELIWSNSAGATDSSSEFGGTGGSPFNFSIVTGDYLTAIQGTIGTYNDSVRLFSLQFFTKNNTKSPVYGKATSYNFSYVCPTGYQITGIFGRSGSAVDALGVYVDPIP